MSRAEELFARIKSGGEAAIDGFITDFESESLWLDFKGSADSGSGNSLHQNDRQSLAKAISGFANSDGGVVVWGVDCRRDSKTGADLPGPKLPIHQPRRFISWLESSVSSCVTPPAPLLEHVAILTSDPAMGFVATLVPRSDLAPHQCIQPATKLQYFMRTGSSFLPVPHAVLAGMFGRRPHAKLLTLFDGKPAFLENQNLLQLHFSVVLMNKGPMPVSGVYVSFHVLVEKPNCSVEFTRGQEQWNANQSYGSYFNATAAPDFRLAPFSPAQPVSIQLLFKPPFNDRFVFEMHTGGEGAEPEHRLVELTMWEVSQAFAKAADILRLKQRDQATREVFPLFLGPTVQIR